MLDSDESYGWALFADLRNRGIGVDQSLAYRDLRTLERDGLVTSRWKKSGAGPQRRFYRLTPDGRDALRDLAAEVREARELHEAFVRAHQDVGRPPRGKPAPLKRGNKSAAQGGTRPGPELRAAWLLLLLARSASYGYELRAELDARDVRIDPASVYRLLRKLEGAGWLASRWLSPSAGPRRRLYRVTPAGRRKLEELVALITASRDAHREFLRAYEAGVAPSGS